MTDPDWFTRGMPHIWLPYTQMKTSVPPPAVVRTDGSRIILADGREPITQQVEVAKNERSFVEVKLRYALPRVVAAEKELTRASDAPASITVISAEEIRGFGYTTLAEALQAVRGLYTTYDRDYATLGVSLTRSRPRSRRIATCCSSGSRISAEPWLERPGDWP